jgi:hypothetical protein
LNVSNLILIIIILYYVINEYYIIYNNLYNKIIYSMYIKYNILYTSIYTYIMLREKNTQQWFMYFLSDIEKKSFCQLWFNYCTVYSRHTQDTWANRPLMPLLSGDLLRQGSHPSLCVEALIWCNSFIWVLLFCCLNFQIINYKMYDTLSNEAPTTSHRKWYSSQFKEPWRCMSWEKYRQKNTQYIE